VRVSIPCPEIVKVWGVEGVALWISSEEPVVTVTVLGEKK